MKLEVGVCVNGDVGEIAWCPRGGSSKPQSTTSGHEGEDGEQEDAPSPAKAKGKTKAKGKGKVKAGKEDQTAAATDKARVDPGVGMVDEPAPHLGILAAVMADGALSFFAIPDPSRIPSVLGADPSELSAPSFGMSFAQLISLHERMLTAKTIGRCSENRTALPIAPPEFDHLVCRLGRSRDGRGWLYRRFVSLLGVPQPATAADGLESSGTIAVWRVGDAIRSKGRNGESRTGARPKRSIRD